MNACLKLRDMLEDGSIVIKSKIVLSELKNYIRTRTGFEAKSGSTDDCISALLIVIRILDEIIQFDDDAFAMMMDKLDDDYFDETGNVNISADDQAMPMVF